LSSCFKKKEFRMEKYQPEIDKVIRYWDATPIIIDAIFRSTRLKKKKKKNQGDDLDNPELIHLKFLTFSTFQRHFNVFKLQYLAFVSKVLGQRHSNNFIRKTAIDTWNHLLHVDIQGIDSTKQELNGTNRVKKDNSDQPLKDSSRRRESNGQTEDANPILRKNQKPIKLRDQHFHQIMEIYHRLGDVTKQFLTTARNYDQEISLTDIFKAGRTVWFMVAFQLIKDLKVEFTTSIFGYNMLYPYTDNLVDDTNLSGAEKKEFSICFRDRLSGKITTTDNPHHKKPFDMVSEIEKQWKREDYPAIYEALLLIHDAQSLSASQIKNNYNPTEEPNENKNQSFEEFIKYVSVFKGGASVLAGGILITGELSEEEVEFLFYLGFALQLLDDLQDVKEDAANNQRTLFSDAYLKGIPLDDTVAKLINFVHHPLVLKPFSTEKKDGMAYYVRRSMVKFSTLLILEAASKVPDLFSGEFFRQLESLSPFPFSVISKLRIEDILWNIVHNQEF